MAIPPLSDPKSDQVGQLRSTFSPSPVMGLPPRWNVGDLSQSYSTPVDMITAAAGDTTSAAFNPQANSVELWVTFSDNLTSCSIVVYGDIGDGTFQEVATFDNVNMLNCSNLSVGEFANNIRLGGRAIKVATTNHAGPGTVTVRCNRLS